MDSATTNVKFVTQSSGGDDTTVDPPLSFHALDQIEHALDEEFSAVDASSEPSIERAGSNVDHADVSSELLLKMSICQRLGDVCHVLVDDLKQLLGVDQVALGLCQGRAKNCRLAAISRITRFDKHSEFVRSIEAALDEAVSHGDATSHQRSQDHAAPILDRVCVQSNVTNVYSSPIRDASGEVIGAWVFFGGPSLAEDSDQVQFIQSLNQQAGSLLRLLQRAERGPVTRLAQKILESHKTWQGKTIMVAVCLITVVLAIPMSYRISCDCQLQPVVRRFVAAPFDGRLEKAEVTPGDVVTDSEVLARMDGREIRWELAGLRAEHKQAIKQREAALAGNKVAEAQLAQLETQRLQLKIQLLEHRSDHLEIKSPLAGIVVSGDLEKAEGAPLDIGQTMFEIAPLDRMIVEVDIPEEDIAHVKTGMETTVRLDAFPRKEWTATIVKIHPRSEIREHDNVFVAEMALDNTDQLLRPGMKGRAKITGPSKTLAWNLFHKAWDSVLLRMGW